MVVSFRKFAQEKKRTIFDCLAEAIARLNLAIKNHAYETDIPNNSMTHRFMAILVQEGLVQNFTINRATIKIFMTYYNGHAPFKGIYKISQRSHRWYVNYKYLLRFAGKWPQCVVVLSTNRGITTFNRLRIANERQGGELLYIIERLKMNQRSKKIYFPFKRVRVFFTFYENGFYMITVKGIYGTLQKKFHSTQLLMMATRPDKNQSYELLLNSLRDYKPILVYLKQSLIGVMRGYKLNFVTHGILFACGLPSRKWRQTHKRQYIYLRLGFRHYVVCRLPSYSHVWAEKRRIYITSIDYHKLKNFVIQIRRLVWPDTYTGTGIQYLGESVKLKPGKRRT